MSEEITEVTKLHIWLHTLDVLSIPFGGEKVEDLVEKSLNWVADEVHDF